MAPTARDVGERVHDLDEPLDGIVGRAAEITGNAADRDAQDEGDGDAHEAHRKADPRAANQPAEEILAVFVGAREKERGFRARRPALFDPEETSLAWEQAP